jgi:hypothetical protein
VREPDGSRGEERGHHGGVFGGDAVAVERREREHLVARRHVAHVGRDLGDHARQLM